MNSSELKGYLTGLILGDGHIDGGVTKRSFSIKSVNEDFIQKIKSDLSSCTNFHMFVRNRKPYESNGVFHKESHELVVKAHPYFAKKYHHFYGDMRERVVSKDAILWLTPAGLANWYMSDGYVCLVGKKSGKVYNRRVEICTDRYDRETVARLAEMLSKKFGVYASVVKRQGRYRIHVLTESYERFFGLISDYVVESMRYKLYLGYEFQPKWMSDAMWKQQKELESAITRDALAG